MASYVTPASLAPLGCPTSAHDSPAPQTPLVQALPADIGAASAYEAYRMWKHNTFLYEPLSADRVAQREGLIGMAIGEGAFRAWRARASTC